MRRRTFLTAAVSAAAASLPAFRSFSARAGEAAAPTRIIVWYQPNGWMQDPAAMHARSLATLAAHRSDILYLRGMHLPTADGGHEGPMESMLRGGFDGASFDQQIAGVIGKQTPVSVLAQGVRSEAGGEGGQCSFLADGTPTPRLERPEDTWATVFAGLNPSGDPEAQAQLAALWARRDRIMTHNQRLAESLRSRLAAGQRERLDQYISSIDDIRDEMTSMADTSEGCVIPESPAATPAGAWNDFSNYEAIASGQISMLAHAVACDLTRVGLIQFNRSVSQIDFGQVVGGSYLDQHHALSHMPGDDEAEQQLQGILDWYDAKLLDLVDHLASRTDVDGSRVLDNTIIVRVTECMLSNGHEFAEGHHLLLGGRNRLTTGVDVTVSNDDVLAKLWRTLAVAVGADLDVVAGYDGAIYDQLLA